MAGTGRGITGIAVRARRSTPSPAAVVFLTAPPRGAPLEGATAKQIGITLIDLSQLEQLVSEEEIWEVIKALPADRAPGPDGFTGKFYKSAWPIIKEQIVAAINAVLFGDSRAFGRLNSTLIVLLPKTPDANEPGHFRPITMIHSLTKLLSKILAMRLAPRM